MNIAVYYNLNYGGAKRSVQEHVKGLSRLGHNVDVYTTDDEKDDLSPGLYARKEFNYKFNILKISIPIISRIAKDFSVFIILKNLHEKIASDIDERKYDIVLVHTDFYTQSPFILRFLKTKNAYYILEPLRIASEYALRIPSDWNILNKLYETINRYIRKKIDIKNARSANYYLSISFLGKFYAAQIYDIYSKVSYLGVDKDIFKPLNIKKKNQILFVAPKDYIFGYDLILEAQKLIHKNIRPQLRIIFGSDKKRRISDKDLVREYNQSIVTISLSRLDTFGLVPLESMACGTPVIATNMPSYKEIIDDGLTGYFTEFDPVELSEKIMYIIKNPKLARKLGNNGREIIEEKWSWEKRSRELEQNLIKLLIK